MCQISAIHASTHVSDNPALTAHCHQREVTINNIRNTTNQMILIKVLLLALNVRKPEKTRKKEKLMGMRLYEYKYVAE